MKQYQFTAKLEPGEGGGVYVIFPYDVANEFGKGRVPVKCTFDGEPYRGTMIKYNTPYHIIIVLKSICKKINKKAGDEVDVWLVEDKEERVVDVPVAFAKLLKKHKLEKLFSEMSYSHRKEWVQWIVSAKREETRQSRMQKAIEKLKDKNT
jgi:hypothetical protein